VPVTIRPAAADDQPTIRRLVREAHINPRDLNWPNFVVAEDDGAIVGVGQVKAHRDGSRELASIAVVPARQRQGIGRALIETLLTREQGAALHLTCRSELQSYYERFGFRRLERAEYPPYFARIVPMINFVMRFFGMRILVMRREAAG
jgi:N-acetylglutamate synthase-like GNAT family acetyltransferase